jgi:hypothetical protein
MKNNLFIYISIIISIFSFSCNPAEKDEIKLLVVCNGTFSGWFYLNGDTPATGFGGGSTTRPYVQTGSTYYYEEIYTDLSTLEITATRDNCTDPIWIKIYRNDKKVTEKMLDANYSTSCSTNSISLDYIYEEENTDNTTQE